MIKSTPWRSMLALQLPLSQFVCYYLCPYLLESHWLWRAKKYKGCIKQLLSTRKSDSPTHRTFHRPAWGGPLNSAGYSTVTCRWVAVWLNMGRNDKVGWAGDKGLGGIGGGNSSLGGDGGGCDAKNIVGRWYKNGCSFLIFLGGGTNEGGAISSSCTNNSWFIHSWTVSIPCSMYTPPK